MQDSGTNRQPEHVKQDHSQAVLVTSLIWFVVVVVAAFIAYRQGEAHAVHCVMSFGTEC